MNPDWIIPDWPAPDCVRAVFTKRDGGVSQGPFAGLNLGDHVGDEAGKVSTNRTALAQSLQARPVFLQQTHGTAVRQLQVGMPDGEVADGASTQLTGLACTVMVADCLPVLLCSSSGDRVAALHAGWRGLAGVNGRGIVEAGFEHFLPQAPAAYAQAAPDLIAWLGPCIGPEAFEVGDDVRDAFVASMPQAAACFQALTAAKWLADLAALARLRLQALGVTAIYGNDSSARWCTYNNPSRFFSHRRDRVSGRMAACVWRT